MKKIILTAISLVLAVLISGCDDLVGAPPTLTPTVEMPPLEASPTVDIRPPTPINGDSSSVLPGQNNPTAAAAPAQSEVLPGTPSFDPARPLLLEIAVANGSTLNAELFVPGQRAPGVVLIGSAFDDWGAFPTMLRESGFAVLVVQARIPALEGDFLAMMDTLSGSQAVNSEALAVIGAASGADVAVNGCAGDERCDVLVLLSPLRVESNLSAVRAFSPRPLMMAASEDDGLSFQAMEALRQVATGDVVVQPFQEAGRGTQILENRADMRDFIIQWLRRYLVEGQGA
jgi:hypothetical protein